MKRFQCWSLPVPEVEMEMHNEALWYQNTERMGKTYMRDAQYRGAFWLSALCLGLMCILQATLNIVLRLHFAFPEDQCNNQTLSTDCEQLLSCYTHLHTNYSGLVKVQNQLEKKREELHNRLSDIAEHINKPGWIFFNSSIYYMSTEKKSWKDSRRYCRERAADLVIITSRGEQDFIEMLRRGRVAWIGLSDRDMEAMWKWVDGTPLITVYWWTWEPNNTNGKEDCAATGFSPDDGRPVMDILNTWNDDSCSVSAYWICEKTISI